MNVRVTIVDDNNVDVVIAFSSAYDVKILESVHTRDPRIKIRDWDIPMSQIKEVSINNCIFINKARRKENV